tara:strand:- start:1541 stop:2479 length:939 start_codon:yes stop_codon:yes gene_type:complete
MADIKFSQFTAEADLSNFTCVVGYEGAGPSNVRITPTELVASLEGLLFTGTPLPVSKGGTGDSTFASGFLKSPGLTSSFITVASIDVATDITGVVPIANGGTGQSTQQLAINALTNAGASSGGDLIQSDGTNAVFVPGINVTGYSMVQVFVWPNGTPVAYTNWGSGVASLLPFNTTARVAAQKNAPGPTAFTTYGWTCANAAGGTAGQVATFTLGTDGGGTWKVGTCQHWFDQTNQVEVRVSLVIPGPSTVDVIDEKSTELTGDKIFYGELIETFAAGDTVQVEVEFTGGGITPFPSDTGNRPIEISFERLN